VASRYSGLNSSIKSSYYAAKKGFWTYLGTNGRLLRPEVADRLGDAGVAVINLALDAWDEKPCLPKALVPGEKNLEHLIRKQYAHEYMVFFNTKICRNNHEDVRLLTEYPHDHHLATDYHITRRPCSNRMTTLSTDTTTRLIFAPEDWRAVDELIDWIIDKNRTAIRW
jgi:hypothetical protein